MSRAACQIPCGFRPSTILSWAHDAFNEGEFDEADLEVIRDVVAQLGLADVAPLASPLFLVTAIL